MALVGAIWIEPAWDEGARTVTLRVRTQDEIARMVRDRSREFGERLIRSATERSGDDLPGVGSGRSEHFTPEERRQLERLIESKSNKE